MLVAAVVALLATMLMPRSESSTDDVAPSPMPDLPSPGPPPSEAAFVVSPDGNDSNPGTAAAPLRTLEQARSAVRDRLDGMSSDLVIYLRGGRYELAEPFALTADDAGRNGYDVVYKAYPDETPVLTRAQEVGEWIRSEDDPDIFTTDLGTDITTRHLYVDGERAVRARTDRNPSGFLRTDAGYTVGFPGMQDWRNPEDIEVVGYAEWRDYHCGVASISESDIVIDEPCWQSAGTEPAISEPAHIENAFELLDSPGEWYHDRSTGELFYHPRPGESMGSAEVLVASGDQVITGSGVHDVRLEGLTMSFNGWTGPEGPDGYAPIQTGQLMAPEGGPTTVPGAVHLSDSHDLLLAGNMFSQLGTAGLVLDGGSRQISVIGNRFADISSHAISIGDIRDADVTDADQMHRDITVANNVITRIGREFRDSPGVFLAYVRDTVVNNNQITEIPYSGITMGWGWGTESYARDNVIAYNRIDNYTRVLDDSAGVYTLSPQPATEIHHNHISENHGLYGCLYPDEGSAEMRWHNNVCERLSGSRSRPGEWLHIWRDDIRDLVIEDNFTDTDALENEGTNITMRNNTVVEDRDWPAEAQQIIDGAGLQPAFSELR